MRPNAAPSSLASQTFGLACWLLGACWGHMAWASAPGDAVFRNRCAVCHGSQADGKSDLARLMRPPPANLRTSKLDDAQRAEIVRKGGEAVGRSPNMPTWEHELSEAEIQAVLAFVRSIKGTTP